MGWPCSCKKCLLLSHLKSETRYVKHSAHFVKYGIFKIYFIYNFVDSSCQYSCSDKWSFFWSSFEIVLSSISFCSSSLFATTDRLIRTELTKNTGTNKIPTCFLFSALSTKIDTTLDWRGEVECRGADHADDDRVVEEDHDEQRHWGVTNCWIRVEGEECLMAGDQPKTGISSRPQIAPGPLSSFPGQAGAGARQSVLGCGEMADSVITCFDGVSGAWWG